MYPFVVLCGVLVALAGSALGSQEEPTVLHSLYNLYKDCGSLSVLEECLSKKVAVDMDRLQRAELIPLNDWLSLKRSDKIEDPPITEEKLEMTTGRGFANKQEMLDSIVMDKIAGLVSGRSLQFQWKPSTSLDEVEARTMKLKPKHIFPFLMGVMLKLLAFLPIVLATLSVMAFKAVIAGKLALAMSSFIGFKKLMHHDNQDNHHISLDMLKTMMSQGGQGGGVGGIGGSGGSLYGRSDLFKRH